jgi:Anti-sigma-K factor rskA
MKHVDPEVLALIAIGEPAANEAEIAHLNSCQACSRDLRALTRAAQVGRAAAGVGPLARPDARVWNAIQAELNGDDGNAAGSVTPIDSRRTARRIAFALAAAVIAAVLAVGGISAWNALRPAPSATVAAARLTSLPAWQGTASGSAVVVETTGGVRTVTIHLTVTAPAKYRQAWLMTPDLKHFIRIGAVDGSVATLEIPKGADIGLYNVLDISDEPTSSVIHPSDNSIVRGTLSPR